jgi:ABC-2 type transport system ATP-binding protein
MDPILEVCALHKDFYPPLSFSQLFWPPLRKKNPHRALSDLSFSLRKGQVLGILGPNGAGKTTLLKILSTLVLPDQGKVHVNGLSLGKDDEKIRALVGLVSEEERGFYWRLSGRQNLEFFGALFKVDKGILRKRIQGLLDLFKVADVDKRFDSYSTGMKKRFSLIRGLLHDPGLLLLDEPTKSLDHAASIDLRAFIKKELAGRQGKTVIFTTHAIDEAAGLADIFMVLHKGKVRAMGSLEELRQTAQEPEASLSEIFLKLTRG